MNTNNNTRTSLHWAFVGALAALIGFLSVGKLQTIWNMNLAVSITIGIAITLLCGLILYHPMELVTNVQHSYRKAITASFQYLKNCKVKMRARIEAVRTYEIERATGKYKWWYRRLDMYEKQIKTFEKIQFLILITIGFSWILPLIGAVCIFTRNSRLFISVGIPVFIFMVLFCWLISKNSESFYLRRFVPTLDRRLRLSMGSWSIPTHCPVGQNNFQYEFFLRRFAELEDVPNSGFHGRYVTYRLKQPYKTWKSFYRFLLEAEKRTLIHYFFPHVMFRTCVFIFGIVLKLVFKTIPYYVILFVNAVPSVYNFAMIFVKEFCAVLYCLLNTSPRRAIFICSAVGYFAGFGAEFLGAHTTAPFWCFGVGFVFGFIQNYVFRRIEHRLQAIIEKSQFASGRAMS